MLEAWLDARDSGALRAAWESLAPQTIELAPEGAQLTGYGAVNLAHELLGIPRDDLAWLALGTYDMISAPQVPSEWEAERKKVPSCFLDGVIDARETCRESWQLRELVHGARGVQHVTVGYHIGRSREARSDRTSVIRVFDRVAGIGICVPVAGRSAFLVAPPPSRDELTSTVRRVLDLSQRRHSYEDSEWRPWKRTLARALFAELAPIVELAFAGSATWPGGITDQRGLGPPDDRSHLTVHRFAQGAYALEVEERQWQGPGGTEDVTAFGLPPGWHLAVRVDATSDEGAKVSVDMRVPVAIGDAIVAKLPR